MFDEHLDYNYGTEILANSEGSALSSIVTKVKTNIGINSKSYTKLYDMCVRPILEYFSSIWGIDDFSHINDVHKRAIHFNMGLPRNAPICGNIGDSGWYPPLINNFVNV